MPNQTLVQVPAKISSEKELRVFLVRLVEQLDIVLGFRGNSGFASAIDDSIESLSTAVSDQLKALEDKVNKNADNISSNSQAIQQNADNISSNSQAIQQNADNISSNSQAIQQNADNISSNSQAIQQNAGKITELQELTYNVDTYGVVAEIEDMIS